MTTLAAYFLLLAMLSMVPAIFGAPAKPHQQTRAEYVFATLQLSLLAAYCFTGAGILFTLAMVVLALNLGLGVGKSGAEKKDQR